MAEVHHSRLCVAASGVRSAELLATGGVRLNRADYPPGLRQPRHDHSFMSISVVLTGSLRERVGSGEAVGSGLNVIVRRAGMEHTCDWGRQGARTLSLELEASDLPGTAPAFSIPRPWMWLRSEQLVRAMVRLYGGARAGRPATETIDLVLEVLAAMEPEGSATAEAAPAWVNRARDAFHDQIRRRPSTRELAADAGITPVHFARVFRRYTGCSPTEYARRVRLRAALEALARTDCEIGRIPYRCGYYDHSHMCRDLRRSLDATPSLLRALAAPLPTASNPTS